MTAKLQLHMEEVPPTGALSAPGALNALGRPALELWELFVRETIQNSWDAKRADYKKPVQYRIDVRNFSDKQFDFLIKKVVPWLPNDGNDTQWDALQDHSLAAISVSDYGTTGLGGSVRADVLDGNTSDFADFVWNVGAPPDKTRGGGTYGYGKSVFYRVSSAATIVVYTRCLTSCGYESRFIVAALGQPFADEESGKRLTGRHWWGAGSRAGHFAPAIGNQADELAAGLGIPLRSGSETGTTIMSLAVELEEDIQDLLTRLADAALWHCWPKMVDAGDGIGMTFEFAADGETRTSPSPEKHPVLKHFVAALRETTKDKGAKGVTHIRSERPKRPLGDLALRHFPYSPSEMNTNNLGPLSEGCHHVALMRAPKLVVRYLSGPESSVPMTAWAGVFVADDDADRDFAASETPTHDDWVPGAVSDKRQKSAVRVALRVIKQKVKEFNRPIGFDDPPESRPLGKLADALGNLVSTGLGTGTAIPEPQPRRTKKGSGRTVAVASATKTGEHLELIGGLPSVCVDFTVDSASGSDGTRVEALTSVAVNDGSASEKDPPLSAETPRVLGFVDPSGRKIDTECIFVDADDDGTWQVRVSMPPDAAVSVRLRASEVRD